MNTSLAFSSTFLLGALHALEPGHGKSFLAAYTLGQKLRFRHIFALGGSLLLSHFSMLIIIAIVLKYLFAEVSSETIYHFNSWFVPMAIIAFGCYLLYRSLASKSDTTSCSCGHHHPEQAHHLHFSPLKQNNVQAHSPAITTNLQNVLPLHMEVKESPEQETEKLGKIALVGLISGFIPCPTAIVPVMLSGVTDNFSNALVYILIYVLGMSFVLTSLIAIFYLAKDLILERFDQLNNQFNPQLISAILVLLVGFVYFGYTMMGHTH